ncbi:MAG: hypothetical protein QOI58_1300 [Thermoanaerobaculia bacterium]|jgi:hypothetical protein|nr:hypothetical protein [Thermoanaerobaculia bacterium]
MNRKSSTANPFLVGLLLLSAAVPSAFAQEPPDSQKHDMDKQATLLPDPPAKELFVPDPEYPPGYDAQANLDVYGTKHMNPNPTMIPAIAWGIRMYDHGAYTPRPTWLFGAKDPVQSGFMAYGDLRVAADSYDTGTTGKKQSTVAARLNLDMDLALTATERIHAFTRPLDKGGQFTRYDVSGAVKDKFTRKFDFDLDTLFFEGDLGQITGGLQNHAARFDLPIAFGRMPFVTQNGVWIEDAFDGAAFSFTAKNIPSLDVSNTDLTFFAGWAQLTTDAAPNSSRNGVFGLAGFADAKKGYIEYGYGYVKADDDNLSYHNVTAAFSRRYWGRIANSVRVIGNFGQKGDPGKAKTADGALFLFESSITPKYLKLAQANQSNFVPYLNLFAGFNSPQSLARGADSGGVLRNTGITFESDGMTAYPTLDAKAHKSYGGALGLEYLFDLFHQIVIEGSAVQRMSGNKAGDQYGIGIRYQQPISPDLIIRFDAMKGWLKGQKDVYGVRAEIRLKF